MSIVRLAEHPEHVPTVAAWHHAEWAHLNPGRGEAERIAEFRAEEGASAIPISWIALEDAHPVGSTSLLLEDMETHPELGPWLGSVYVEPDRRARGIASALVDHAIGHARGLGVEALWLFTPDQERLYARQGFRRIAREVYHGETEVLMRLDL